MGRRGAFAGQAWRLFAPMDVVPYPQPLTGHESQYVAWGVLRVRPMGHPSRPVPPWAAGQRSQAYPTLLHALRWGRNGHRGGGGGLTSEAGSPPIVPCGLLWSRPPSRDFGVCPYDFCRSFSLGPRHLASLGEGTLWAFCLCVPLLPPPSFRPLLSFT